MRLRTPLFALSIAALTVFAGCSGQPENSPAIRKKFAEYDQNAKAIERMSKDLASMTEQVSRLSEENSELRALAPDANGLTALDKLDTYDSRIAKLEDLAGQGIIQSSIKGGSTKDSTKKSKDAPAVMTADAGSPANDLSVAELSTGPVGELAGLDSAAHGPVAAEPAAAVTKKASTKQLITPPAVKESSTKSSKKSSKPAAKSSTSSSRSTASTPAKSSGKYYVIAAGETVDSIAKKNDLSVDKLLKANGLPKGIRLAKGQKLFVPGS